MLNRACFFLAYHRRHHFLALLRNIQLPIKLFFFHSLWEVIICMSDEKINGYSADQVFTMWPRQFALLLKDALSGFNFWPWSLAQAVQGIALQLRNKTFLKSHIIWQKIIQFVHYQIDLLFHQLIQIITLDFSQNVKILLKYPRTCQFFVESITSNIDNGNVSIKVIKRDLPRVGSNHKPFD